MTLLGVSHEWIRERDQLEEVSGRCQKGRSEAGLGESKEVPAKVQNFVGIVSNDSFDITSRRLED